MATTKTLQGIIRITEVGDYNLALPDNGARAQNSLAIKNVEDVYIIIENVEIVPPNAINIFLPKISTFNGGWNGKIHILSKIEAFARFSLQLNSYSSEVLFDSDWINIQGQNSVGLSAYTLLQIVDNYWAIIQAQ